MPDRICCFGSAHVFQAPGCMSPSETNSLTHACCAAKSQDRFCIHLFCIQIQLSRILSTATVPQPSLSSNLYVCLFADYRGSALHHLHISHRTAIPGPVTDSWKGPPLPLHTVSTHSAAEAPSAPAHTASGLMFALSDEWLHDMTPPFTL